MLTILNLPILIEWDKFKEGTSFFIPCLERRTAQRYVQGEARRHKIRVICKQVIENNIYGLRVWRDTDIIQPHSTSPRSI
jgi:hypothetical protein